MADFNQINQFGSAKPSRTGEGVSCAECEAMLTDFIDGTLTPKDQAAFELHIATCKECSQMLADAQRGAALLEMLKFPRPEPSATLFDRIIAHTSGSPAVGIVDIGAVSTTSLSDLDSAAGDIHKSPAAAGVVTLLPAMPGKVLPFRVRVARSFSLQAITRTMIQPRLAMTAAMAFFSIALTMNLTGVHLSGLKASDLKPSSIRHTFYQADASLVRYYDNLRVVYELESRVNGLKQSESDSPSAGSKSGSQGDATGTPGSREKSGKDGDQKRTQPKAGSGTSQHRDPLLPEFKLALGHIHPRTDSDTTAALNPAVLGAPKYTLKESLQEGGLV